MPRQRHCRTAGFTIVEVLMAAAILVVGFMGMIQAVTIGSDMLATARRQTLANQIITHELEKLRLKTWTELSALPAAPAVTIDSQFASAIAACGLTTDASVETNTYIKLECAVTEVISGELREVTFTVTWRKAGLSTASSGANSSSSQTLNQLAFFRSSTTSRIYVRSMSAYFGKYGLNLNTRRS